MEFRRLRPRRPRDRRASPRRLRVRNRRARRDPAPPAHPLALGAQLRHGRRRRPGLTAPWITRIFTTDQTVIDYATVAIIVGAFFQPIAGYVFLLDGILIGAGRGRYLAGASVLNLLVYAPVLWLIAHSARLTDSPSVALALVWLAYSAVYTGMRALTNGYGARSL